MDPEKASGRNGRVELEQGQSVDFAELHRRRKRREHSGMITARNLLIPRSIELEERPVAAKVSRVDWTVILVLVLAFLALLIATFVAGCSGTIISGAPPAVAVEQAGGTAFVDVLVAGRMQHVEAVLAAYNPATGEQRFVARPRADDGDEAVIEPLDDGWIYCQSVDVRLELVTGWIVTIQGVVPPSSGQCVGPFGPLVVTSGDSVLYQWDPNVDPEGPAM